MMGGTCSVLPRDETPELQLIMLPGSDSSDEHCKHRKRHKKKDKQSHPVSSSMSTSQRLPPPSTPHHRHPIIYPMPYYGYTPQGYPLYYPYPPPPPDHASQAEDVSPDAKAHPHLQQYLPAGYVMQHEEQFGSPKFYESIKWMVAKAIDQHLNKPPQDAFDEEFRKTISIKHGHGTHRHVRRSKRDQPKAQLLIEGKLEKTEGTLSEDFGTKKTETLKAKKFPTQELADKIKLLLFGGDKSKQKSSIETANNVVHHTETPPQKCNHRADPDSPAIIFVNVDTKEGDKTPTKITLRIREKTVSLKSKKKKSIDFPSRIRATKARHSAVKSSKFFDAETDSFVKELQLKQPLTPPIEIKNPNLRSKSPKKIEKKNQQKHSSKVEKPSSLSKKVKSKKHSEKPEKPKESPAKWHANLDVENPNFTLKSGSKKNLEAMKSNKESRKTKSQKKVGRFHHIKSPKSLLFGGWVVKSKPHSKSKPTSSTIKPTKAKDSISVNQSDVGAHDSSSFSVASSSSTNKSKPNKFSGRKNEGKPHSPWDKFSRTITKIFQRKKS